MTPLSDVIPLLKSLQWLSTRPRVCLGPSHFYSVTYQSPQLPVLCTPGTKTSRSSFHSQEAPHPRDFESTCCPLCWTAVFSAFPDVSWFWFRSGLNFSLAKSQLGLSTDFNYLHSMYHFDFCFLNTSKYLTVCPPSQVEGKLQWQ